MTTLRARLRTFVRRLLKRLVGVHELETRQAFILFEIQRLEEALRRISYSGASTPDWDVAQTKESFDYQWRDMNEGNALASDQAFMSGIQRNTCELTKLPIEWFPGKKVLDLGCGSGRYSLALLSMGSRVTSVDQSESGVQQTLALCRAFSDRHDTARVDILNWDSDAEFDLVFCFGVVHHTGNTYLAIRNAARKLARGGRLFLLVYGYPATLAEFEDLVQYESLRAQLRGLSFEAKKRFLVDRFGTDRAHGCFDAASPRINDLLSFGELYDFLTALGLVRIERTVEQRNHCVIADKP